MKRKDTLVSAVRKATNLYRRVSVVSYRNTGKANKYIKLSNAKCFACLVTLVKSSKDTQRAGVKLAVSVMSGYVQPASKTTQNGT